MNYNFIGVGGVAHTYAPSMQELRQGDLKCEANLTNITCIKLQVFITKFK